TFKDAAEAIARSQSDADARLAANAAAASSLAAKIAQANQAIATSKDPALLDQRDQAAKQLAALTGGQARIHADGKMRFVIGGGTVLVDGDRAATITATADAAYGNHVRLDVVDGASKIDATKIFDGGKIGGDIAFRDGAAAQAAKDVDQLAYDFAT